MVVFNFCVSSYRITIERAFGMLTGSWLILRTPLEYKLEQNIKIIMACVLLHNFKIDGYEKSRPHHHRNPAALENWLQRQADEILEYQPLEIDPIYMDDPDHEEDGFNINDLRNVDLSRKQRHMRRLYNELLIRVSE